MKTRLFSLGSLAAVLAIASPSIASAEVAPVSETATNTFKSEFVQSNNEAFTASTSAESLGTFESQKQINPTFSEDSNKTEVAQYGDTAEAKSTGIYVGGNLGFFFPLYSNVDSGFGGGGYVGYKFNEKWGAEIDLGYVGADLDNGYDVSLQNFYVLPTARYTIPFGSNDKWTANVGVGLGFASRSYGGDDGDDLDGDSYFTLQVKGGVSYKFNPKLEAFGQVRWINMFDSAINYYGESDSGGFISPELGIQYNF